MLAFEQTKLAMEGSLAQRGWGEAQARGLKFTSLSNLFHTSPQYS